MITIIFYPDYKYIKSEILRVYKSYKTNIQDPIQNCRRKNTYNKKTQKTLTKHVITRLMNKINVSIRN